MKKFLLSVLLGSVACFSFCQAVSLKNIFPQNYGSLVQQKDEDGQRVVSQCGDFVDQALKSAGVGKDFSFATVFSQKIDGRKFFRILLTSVDFEHHDFPSLHSGTYSENDFYWLTHSSHSVVQLIVEENCFGFFFVASDVTGLWQRDNSGTFIYFSDFLISCTLDFTKVIHLQSTVPVSIGSTWDGLMKVAFLSRGANLFGKQKLDCQIFHDGTKSIIEIQPSDFLVDSESPIKYSFLSALDKDSKTCFKENSAENIASLSLNFKMDNLWTKKYGKIQMTQGSLINGDTSSRTAYFDTDRIGTITAEAWENQYTQNAKETSSFQLKDYSLENQGVYLPFREGKNFYIFNTSEIIKAKKHDISISEINFKIAKIGWLF